MSFVNELRTRYEKTIKELRTEIADLKRQLTEANEKLSAATARGDYQPHSTVESERQLVIKITAILEGK